MSYNDRVDVYNDISAAGSSVPDYSGMPTYRDVPCTIRTVAGDETYRGRQLEAHLSHVVELWHLPSITSTTRLVCKSRMIGRALNVRQAREIDQTRGIRQRLELYCEELAPT